VIIDDHQGARLERDVDTAGSIREDQLLDAEQADDARGKCHGSKIVPFIEMSAAREDGYLFARKGTGNELAGVAHDR
jgi:hypothetical protein